MSETIGTGGPAPPGELRLAVAMRGGVSLAVWMGGACQEIEELRRSAEPGPAEDGDGPADLYRTLLGRAGYDEVVVDVLAGTSAGGLNAVLLSCALLYDMPFGEPIRDLWLQVADIMRLCRPASDRNPPSLLRGDAGFYQDLMRSLGDLLKERLEPEREALDETRRRLEQLRERRRVDLLLTCTLLHPASETFHQPVGDPITDARSRAYFRFRNLEQGAVSDFDPFEEQPGGSKDPWEPVRRLAYAGRSTASYPAAFEPATIWAGSGDDHSRPGRGSEPFPRNLYGIFSETPAAPRTEHPAHVIDGGVLDNIPVAWAVRSIAAAKANRPVDRWLLYLQPEPPIAPVPLRNKDDDRGLLRLVPVAVKAHGIKLGSESLLEDVEELRRYEAAAGQRRQVAETLATIPLDLDALLDKAGRALDNRAESGYRRRQARIEAARLARLLETPVEVTGPDPLPFGGVRDPLADMGKAERAALLARLAGPADEGLQALVLPKDVTGDDLGRLHLRLRSLQAVARAVATLLDCARVLERQGLRVPSDGGEGKRAGELAEDELFPLRFAVEMVVGAHDRLLLRRCAQIPKGASATPDEMARDAAAALRRAAEETGVTAEPVKVDRLKKLCERVTVAELPSAAGWPEDGYGWLWEPLRRTAERLAKAVPEDGGAYAYLRDAAGRQPPEVLQALLATEVLFGPVRPDPLSENASIRLHMISAANQSPLNQAIFGEAGPASAKRKLAGNQLNNFGAFLSARWRQNDWTWGRLDAATSLVRLLTRPERMSDEVLAALVADLGGDGAGGSREELVEEVIRLRHERILDGELQVLAGLDDDPPAGRPVPAAEPTPTLLAKVGGETVQDLPEARRRQVIGRVSRLLWRSLKPPGSLALRTVITVTEPLGVLLVRFGLRKFVKLSSRPRR